MKIIDDAGNEEIIASEDWVSDNVNNVKDKEYYPGENLSA